MFAPSGSIHRNGGPRNSGVLDISHGATDASALRLGRVDLLAGRRDGTILKIRAHNSWPIRMVKNVVP